MKKIIYTCLISSLVLVACSSSKPSTSPGKEETQTTQAVKTVKKNPSVSLPVEYFHLQEKDLESDRTKSLISVEWVENNLENQVLANRSYHVEQDYEFFRFLKIKVDERFSNPNIDKIYLNPLYITEKWDFVLGEEGQRDLFYELNFQLKALSSTYIPESADISKEADDYTAEYLIAVPEAIANNPALQLKIMTENQSTGDYKFVYVDLN